MYIYIAIDTHYIFVYIYIYASTGSTPKTPTASAFLIPSLGPGRGRFQTPVDL